MTVRLECLRLAVESGANDAVAEAERYLAFVNSTDSRERLQGTQRRCRESKPDPQAEPSPC